MLILLLVACTKTETFPLEKEQQQIIEQEIETNIVVSDTTQIEAPVTSQNIQSTSTIEEEGISGQSNTKSIQTNEQTAFDPSNEYEVTSCCNEGRLFAQAKNGRNSYSINDVKDLLIKIYKDNCDKLKDKLIQRVYLRFKGDIQDSSYLTYFNAINYKRLQVDYLTLSEDFESCS